MAKRDKQENPSDLEEITQERIKNALSHMGPDTTSEVHREISENIDRALAEDEKLKESKKS